MYFSFFYLFSLTNIISERFHKNDYLFKEISDFHLKILNESKFEEIPVRLEFKEKKSTKKNAIIQNYHFKNHNFRKIRLTYFKSDDKQMFQSVWYPSYDFETPILTIDLINYGKNKTLFFLNLVEIYDKPLYRDPLFQIKKEYYITSEDIPIYFMFIKKYVSKSFVYTYVTDEDITDSIKKLIQRYIMIYLKFFIRRPVNRYYIEDKHRDYNNFRKNIDSLFILNDYFDNDWCKRFIIENYRE
jgi:hypothetical protein